MPEMMPSPKRVAASSGIRPIPTNFGAKPSNTSSVPVSLIVQGRTVAMSSSVLPSFKLSWRTLTAPLKIADWRACGKVMPVSCNALTANSMGGLGHLCNRLLHEFLRLHAEVVVLGKHACGVLIARCPKLIASVLHPRNLTNHRVAHQDLVYVG